MALPLMSLGMSAMGLGSGQKQTSASSRSGDIMHTYEGNSIGAGPGNRDFNNFVTFSGAIADISPISSSGINPPSTGGLSTTNIIMIAGAGLAVLALVVAFRR